MSLKASTRFDLESDAAMAFANGTNLEVDFALSIYVDWNGAEEMEWQVNRIFETLELPYRWAWEPEESNMSISMAFQKLERWLAIRGYSLWLVKTDGDDALAFPVETRNAVVAERIAKKAGMFLFTIENSEPYYGPISR